MIKKRSLLILSLLFGLLFAIPTFASAETNENARSTQSDAVYPSEDEIEAMDAKEVMSLITELEGAYPNEGEMPQEAFLALSIARGQSATYEQEDESDRKAMIITGAVVLVGIYSAGVIYYFENKKKKD
jgi:hypothetical protein